MKIRILSLLLALGVTGAQAQVNYAVSGNTAYVTNSPNASGNVVIASTYNGYPVTVIGALAFEGCVELTSITIPNSVNTIGNQAFFDCTDLTNVVIPGSVSTIGDEAFANCLLLASVQVPASVTTFVGSPFVYCPSLTNISVSASNPDYSSTNGVLFDKAQMTLIQFPGGLGGSYAIPNSVTTIEDYAFGECINLTNVTIPNGVTSIGDYAFNECTGLMNVTIPNSVTNIGVETFDDCLSLTSVTIPNSVTSIEAAAFLNCSNLTNVTISAGVTNIGNYAFDGCSGLTNITFQGNAPTPGVNMFYNVAADANVYYYPYTSGWGSTYGGLPAVELTFSYGLTWITNDAAITITGVTGSPTNFLIPPVIYGYPVTAIANNAFAGKTTITNAIIPGSVTSIGAFAFYQCGSLTGVTISDGVTYIGNYAFDYTGLTSVTIPASVTGLGSTVFSGCASLTNLAVDAANANYASTNGSLCDKSLATLIQAPGGIANYTIPNSVTSIGFGACGYSTVLTNVTIPGSVMTIGADAFVGCPLTSVVFPNSVTSLGDDAFFGCVGLTSVTIPGSITTIGSDVFYNCYDLASLLFLGNAPGLGSSSFTNVSAAAKVYYLAGTTGWGMTYGGLPTVPLGGAYQQISRPVLSGGKVQLSFIGNYGSKYALDRSATLSPPNWVPQITNIAGPGGVLVFTNTPNLTANNFWRIRSVP